jgi:hypothetical protein
MVVCLLAVYRKFLLQGRWRCERARLAAAPECCNYIVDVCGFFRLLLRNANKAKYNRELLAIPFQVLFLTHT